MKTKKLYLLIICVAFSFIALGQNKTIDVLYLKNGSLIKGIITEQIPFKTVTIQTADGSIFVYKSEECDSIKKIVSNNISAGIQDEILNAEKNKRKAARKARRDLVPAKFFKKYYYKGIFELNTFIGQNEFDNIYLIKSNAFNSYIGIHTINGIQFFKNYFLGIGLGLNIQTQNQIIEQNNICFPVFLDARRYFRKGKTLPFLNLDGGLLVIPDHNPIVKPNYFVNPSFGIKIYLSGKSSLNISLGYTILYNKALLITEGYGGYYNYMPYDFMKHEVTNQIKGGNLKIGFTF